MKLLLVLALLAVPQAWAAHAYSQFGDIKYPAGFKHFEWVNPDAPKGGDIDLVPPLRITNFDKYNPFTLKGTSPPGLGALVFESLLTGTMDEPTTAYGLLAEDVTVAADGLSVTFRLNPAARFQNGTPVLAADVKHSFDTLMSKQAAPQYRVVYGDVRQAVVTGERTVRFDFKRANAELPLMVGGLPVFSRAWGAGKPFDQVVMDMPIASGPYKIGRLNFGRDITYERDPNYWARDLNVRRGRYNFDRITYKIYKDTTAQTEAFKAGEFDYLRTFSAREWARTYVGKKFDSGELIKAELPVKNAGDFQGFLINVRREKFKDPRVRQALGLAFDFEWMNRQMMYNSYQRVRGFFNASDFEAKGLPGPDELKVLAAAEEELPEKIFTAGRAAAAVDQPAGQPARQPAQGARPAGRGRLDLSRRRAAQQEGRAVHAGVPRQRRRRAAGGAVFPGAGQARHRGRIPPRGLRADPQAARRVRLRYLHRAHSRQRGARRRAARPLRLGVGRYRGLEQPDRHQGSGDRRAGEPGGFRAHAARAGGAAARARPRAAPPVLRGAAVVLEHLPDRLPRRASSSSRRSCRSTTRRKTG